MTSGNGNGKQQLVIFGAVVALILGLVSWEFASTQHLEVITAKLEDRVDALRTNLSELQASVLRMKEILLDLTLKVNRQRQDQAP
jgi:hypothetical protein